MLVYKLLDLSTGEFAQMIVDGNEQTLVFDNIKEAQKAIDFLCALCFEELKPCYFEIVRAEVDEKDVQKHLWTVD
jgi:hypothetical protein